MNLRLPLIAAALALGLGSGRALSAENELTAAEKAAGWTLLFDGASFAGWRGYRLPGLPAQGWEINDGTLRAVPKVKGAELITTRTFTDFELSWEWNIAEAGNNGVKYFVTEDRPKSPGVEYQMIDDQKNSDAVSNPLHQTAAFYDVLPAAADKPLHPPGEWNRSQVVVRGRHVEHSLNGRLVLSYELGSDAVKAGLARSKFKDQPGFGEKITGPIMLTYHGDACAFRNLKVREIH
jgi:hypothetical protein